LKLCLRLVFLRAGFELLDIVPHLNECCWYDCVIGGVKWCKFLLPSYFKADDSLPLVCGRQARVNDWYWSIDSLNYGKIVPPESHELVGIFVMCRWVRVWQIKQVILQETHMGAAWVDARNNYCSYENHNGPNFQCRLKVIFVSLWDLVVFFNQRAISWIVMGSRVIHMALLADILVASIRRLLPCDSNNKETVGLNETKYSKNKETFLLNESMFQWL